MSAYIVTHIHVHDPEAFEQFVAAVEPLFAKSGGEFVVRSSECTALEGECPSRLLIQRFPDAKTARDYFENEERLRLRDTMTPGCTFNAVLVEGV